MKYCINVQSVSDLITNSSSEVFTIRTDTPEYLIRDWLDDTLRVWGYSEEEIMNDNTIRGLVYSYTPGVVVISYDTMCNVDKSLYGLLVTTFGDKNVSIFY